MQERCKLFLSDLKGTIFYGVPHAGGQEAKKNNTWLGNANKSLLPT